MISARMKHALELADKCWAKAYASEPKFVEDYLECAEVVLTSKPTVTGDEFREACRLRGVRRPAGLHPNVWVSGVRALHSVGWIERIGYVEPVKAHNHMPTVTLWRSRIFGQTT